uniref:HORMA domain-containing protein n=1 Tax=Panagrellus redivivus TaxID=6233 RepID=A0A7E4UU86_PANRE
MVDVSKAFLTKVRTGVLLLTNLRKLVMHLMFYEIFEPNPHFPYPEHVTLEVIVNKDAVPYFGSLPTFPKVKHLVLNIELYLRIAPEMYRQVATLINCFPNLETTQVNFNVRHKPFPDDVSVITNFHEGLRTTDFSTPVEMNFNEYVYIGWAKKRVKSISEQWKSYGFEEDGSDSKFIIKKEYENVKLVHRMEYYDD